MSARNWTRVLFEAIDDAVIVHDEHGNILEANPAACRRLGYTRDELLTLTTRDIDAPEFAAGFESRLQSQLESGVTRFEGVHRTKDGRRIHVDINTSSIQLNGKPAILGVSRDISERKATEEMLSKQSQLMQSILDSMSDAIVVADADERIFLFNPQAERIFGPGLLQGNFSLYQSDRVTRLAELPVARCVRGESFDGLELFIRHEDAPTGLWINVAGRPLLERGREIKGGVIVCHDITAQKRHQRQAQAQYELARIIAAEQDFAQSVREILRTLCETLDFDLGLLWQVERSQQALSYAGAWQYPRLHAGSFLMQSQACFQQPSADLAGAVCMHGSPRRAHATESAWASTPRWCAARQAGLQSVLAYPIKSGDEVIAVLELWSLREQEDDTHTLATLATMANSVGQFLDRERVEKELRDSRALYESLVESLPQNIFRKDRSGRVTFGNARYCASLNRTQSELLGKTDFDLFPEDVARKYVADDQRVMQIRETVDTIEEHYLPDGKRLFVHVVKTPVFNAEGDVVGVQGIFWDVTQEVLAHEAVLHSEKRYRQLTEATMDGIIVLDPAGKVALFNPAAERMFGYQADEIIGAAAERLVPHGFGATDRAVLGRPQELTAKRKDGSEFPVEISLSLLTEPGNGHGAEQARLLAAIRDLTERNKMRSVLVQNEKLASIGLLSAGVAHEINNPLAFVANNLVVLERDCQGMLKLLDLYEIGRAEMPSLLAARVRETIEEIDFDYIKGNLPRILSRTRDGIDRVTRIVQSLRGMARTEAPRRQEASIPDLITSSLEILHGRFKRLGITVEQEHDANPTVSCVPTQISQVILNLLVNAFQAIEASKRTDGQIVIRTQRLAGDFLLEIRDNGPGIDPANLSRLFDPFFTTKDVGEGTGLGLSITHHIVSAHGGRIEVDTRVGEGTAFRVYLPLDSK